MHLTNQRPDTEIRWFDLGCKKKLQVKRYQGQIFIDIREYWQKDFQPELYPTKKGVCLTPEIWNTLMMKSTEISEAIDELSGEKP